MPSSRFVSAAFLALVAGTVALAGPSALPGGAVQKVEAFKKVPWGERLRPERGDPAPEGWQSRVEAEWALASLDAAAAEALVPMLGDGDRFVRGLAARSIGIAQPKGAAAAVLAALQNEKDKGTRLLMLEAVARTATQGDAAALAAIEAVSGGGADPDLVFAAGLARRQVKGGRWDVDSIRGEHVEAQRTKIASVKLGAAAPELALPSAAGVVNLSALKGKVVLLVFAHGDRGGADSKALGRMNQESESFTRMGVTVVVVDPHEKERTKLWSERLKLPYTFASDPSGRAQAAYGVARQLFAGAEWLPSPAWFVIDRQGAVQWSRIGRRMDEHPSLGDLLPVLDSVSRNVKPQ